MRSSYKTIGLWVILIALFVCFFHIFNRNQDERCRSRRSPRSCGEDGGEEGPAGQRPREHLLRHAQDTKERFRTIGPPADAVMLQKLRESGVDVKYEREEQNNLWLTILGQWMPVVFLFVFFVFFMRQLQGRAGRP